MWQVVGQNKVVSLLQHSLERQALAHAYLLVGPPHTGKMTLALNLAQALNCEASEPPCGQCPSCQKIASGKHADVQIISLTSNGNSAEAKSQTEIGIDQIRQLQHSASLPPFEGKYKVFIIDGAELLSNEAANCLLKTLEEPEDRVIFILLTVEERLLLSTVISRCQRLELSPLAASEAEAALTTRWNIEPEQAKLLTRLCHGRLGWAVSAALDASLLQQRTEKIDRLLAILGANYDERFAYATQLANQFSQNREAVQELLNLWLDWWRDLMLVKTGCGDAITNIDFKTTLVNMAGDYSLAQVKTSINSIQATEKELRQNANPRLALEVLMLDIPRRNHG
ncbi:MAG TPA: DNA polymerase III subunit delta' [Dehalococcoidales bacterium]|nr:DNA polymerase III subunit delta' [Dehalococcoidales bacterium]